MRIVQYSGSLCNKRAGRLAVGFHWAAGKHNHQRLTAPAKNVNLSPSWFSPQDQLAAFPPRNSWFFSLRIRWKIYQKWCRARLKRQDQYGGYVTPANNLSAGPDSTQTGWSWNIHSWAGGKGQTKRGGKNGKTPCLCAPPCPPPLHQSLGGKEKKCGVNLNIVRGSGRQFLLGLWLDP